MSDYTVTTDFSVKDGLGTGDPEKLILGSDVDVEFDAIATAIATKYDSDDLASQAVAEAETSNTVLMTPLRVANWADANGGMVGDIQALADPNADTVLGWDDSAGAAIGWTIGTGLLTTAGGVLEMDHLGFEDLTDPGADRVPFWDDSATAFAWATLGGGLEFSTTTLQTNIDGMTDLAVTPAYNDEVPISDGGTDKKVDVAVLTQPPEVLDATTSRTLVISDAGSVVRMSSASAAVVEFPLNATVAFPTDTVIAFERYGAGTVTLQSTAGATLRSPDGVLTIGAQYGRVIARYIGSDEWVIDGRLG